MTAWEKSDELVALEQARAQLEAGLSRDADWLALHQSRRAGAAGNGEAGRSLREARLERALSGNPLYTAWRLVSEAIEVVADIAPETAAPRAEPLPTVEPPPAFVPSGPPDDLTRIRGIRAALARRLAELGITHFSQIAAWRPADVRTVSEALGIGRDISRQNWIEQAALLDLRALGASAREVADAPRERPVGLPDILDHIRSSAPASTALETTSLPGEETPAPPAAQPAVNGALPGDAKPDAPPPVAESAAPSRPAAAADLIPAVAQVNTADRLQRLEEELRHFSETVRATTEQDVLAWEAPLTSDDVALLDGSGSPGRELGERPASESDEEEAVVTFVVRAPPAQSASPGPGDATSPGAGSPLLESQRGLSPDPEPPAAPALQYNGLAEEAEVAIVRPDAGAPQPATASTLQSGHGARAVRRFLKVLTGKAMPGG